MRIPNDWMPREYQLPLWIYMEGGGKRAIEIAHRRWGKDDLALHWTAVSALTRIGTYWHCLPEYEQARKAIWTAVNPHTGKRRIDEAFPPEIRETKDEQQMFIRFKTGSTWQLIGSDRYDATVGAGPVGIVYSEWALANPAAWAYHRPMLVENDGHAMFITTPRGANHAKSMFDMAAKDARWFAEISTVNDTGALSAEQVEDALVEYISIFGEDVGRAQFEQEYLCSFNAAILGAYFGREMAAADREGRIRSVEIDPAHPVHTAWDLGRAANNPIWCFQVIGSEPRIVDFYRPASDDLEEWVRWLDDKGYRGTDFVPHDIMVTEWGTKRTRVETLKLLGRKPRRVAKVSVEDGRQAARQTIKAALIHSGDDERGERMALGIDGLKMYRREWDQELKIYRETPVKDWAEHIGSAFRYLGLAWKEAAAEQVQPEKPVYPVVAAGGSMKTNLTVREMIERNARRRRQTGSVRV